MNIPTSLEAIIIIVLIFIPGYLFLQFTKQTVAFVSKEVDARYFFALVVWGGIIHATSAYWTLPIINWYQNEAMTENSWYILRWSLAVLIALPILLGRISSRLAASTVADELIMKPFGFGFSKRIPSAWNYAILTGPAFVRVHLTDGTVVGGAYGAKSFADHESEQDIFLQTVYNLDENGDFESEVPASGGVWIPRSSINYVLFFRTAVK